MHPSLRIYIGYDSRETAAYAVLAHSIIRRATCPVSIHPVKLNQLAGAFTRPRGPLESTEFSLSRFLVPFLSGYEGYSVFMDCDMLMLADVNELWDHIYEGQPLSRVGRARSCPEWAVKVCKHDYVPTSAFKMDGAVQTTYERKNWSSFVIYNNERCRLLVPSYVNEASPMTLHRFRWLKDRDIGELPLTWNWLVGEYPENPDAKNLHFTLGGPWFGHEPIPEDKLWYAEREDMLRGTYTAS